MNTNKLLKALEIINNMFKDDVLFQKLSDESKLRFALAFMRAFEKTKH